MKSLFFVSVFFLQLGQVHAQKTTRPSASNDSVKSVLVMVDTLTTSIHALIINHNNIESIDVLKDTSATNRFGDKAKNGAILIHTKRGIKLFRLNELLDKFQVADSLRRYRICVNEVVVSRPDLLLIDETEVDGITTFISTDWNGLPISKEEKFLNIVTKSRNPVQRKDDHGQKK